jgi:hypothetical protein
MDMTPDATSFPPEKTSPKMESMSLAAHPKSPPDTLEKDNMTSAPPKAQAEPSRLKLARKPVSRRAFLGLVAAFAAGMGSGYIAWGRPLVGPVQPSGKTNVVPNPQEQPSSELAAAEAPAIPQNLLDEYILPISFGGIGPQLLDSGAIDYDRFVQIYEQAGQPLTADQRAVLTEGSDAPIAINRKTAYFLLNFLWAFGLANKNPLLEEGLMVQYNDGNIEEFASTGGWTLAAKPIPKLYAGAPIVTLTPEQQARLEEVAAGVYRPCCNNPTAFPDCNHGMAMLGLLELMAAEEATVDEMFTAAKYANAFWFPQQTMEIAFAFRSAYGKDFIQADAREFSGPNFSSGSGYGKVHQWLVDNNLLKQAPNQGGGCGV